jgi:LSD1 subclass zinc finger protein
MPGKQFPCNHCGAKLEFQPGSTSLKCPYCGATNSIPQSHDEVAAHDFNAALRDLATKGEHVEALTVNCEACGAKTTLPKNVTADQCPFCGKPIVATLSATTLIKPTAMLSFKITRNEALEKFNSWLKSLWFAPSSLVRDAMTDNRFVGMYVPFWAYDTSTTSFYTGERGVDYQVEETYTAIEDGKEVTRTRMVTRTDWTPTSGVVWEQFKDVLVLASKSLPRAQADRLSPWDLADLQPYQDEFLAGFRSESYAINLEEGFGEAKEVMAPTIRNAVTSDIGGDHQRIFTISTKYDNISFQHLLLPIWISAYQFHGKVYRFLVNARTGHVQGERPYSPIKIALTVLLVLVLIFAIAWLLSNGHRHMGAIERG